MQELRGRDGTVSTIFDFNSDTFNVPTITMICCIFWSLNAFIRITLLQHTTLLVFSILIWLQNFLNPAVLISESSVSILKQPVTSLPLLSTPNLTTVTLCTSVPNSQTNRLQQIQNCLAHAPKFSHIIPILSSVHWLKINERTKLNILLSFTYKVLTTSQPAYTTWQGRLTTKQMLHEKEGGGVSRT